MPSSLLATDALKGVLASEVLKGLHSLSGVTARSGSSRGARAGRAHGSQSRQPLGPPAPPPAASSVAAACCVAASLRYFRSVHSGNRLHPGAGVQVRRRQQLSATAPG